MRIKTIFIIVITVLLTVVLMQNTGQDTFDILWATITIAKLIMLLSFAFVGFVIGVLTARPKRFKKLGTVLPSETTTSGKFNTLSDEDKDYIK